MISRINRTGRRRIHLRDIALQLREAERQEAPIFDLDLRLDDYDFPPEARVRVEAWRGNASQRWDFGTVGRLAPPPESDRRLTDLPAGVRFRVFVVAADESGKLLGHAPAIRPKLPLNSLLPLEEADLGAEVWRVQFDGEDANPVLLVNGNIPGISEAVRHDPTFRSLVIPEVFRTILTRMVLIDRPDWNDPDGPWEDWFKTACAYLPNVEPVQLPADGRLESAKVEDANRWIDAVVGHLPKGRSTQPTPTGRISREGAIDASARRAGSGTSGSGGDPLCADADRCQLTRQLA